MERIKKYTVLLFKEGWWIYIVAPIIVAMIGIILFGVD